MSVAMKVVLVTCLVGCVVDLCLAGGPFDFLIPKPKAKPVDTIGRYNITGLEGSRYFYETTALNRVLEVQIYGFGDSDLDPNLKLAGQLYDNPPKDILAVYPDFLNALRIFQSLHTLNMQNHCSKYSSQVLGNNYLAAFGRPEWGYEEEYKYRRVNKIVRRLSWAHAQICEKKYMPKYDELYKNVDAKGVLDINKMIDYLIQRQEDESKRPTTWTNAQELMEFSKERRYMFLDIWQHPTRTIDMLNDLGKGDPDLKWLTTPVEQGNGFHWMGMDKDKIKKVVYRYLLNPCYAYINALEEVFEPAEFDAKFILNINQDRLDYYQSWARYRYCSSLVALPLDLVGDIVSMGDYKIQSERFTKKD